MYITTCNDVCMDVGWTPEEKRTPHNNKQTYHLSWQNFTQNVTLLFFLWEGMAKTAVTSM